MKKTHKYFLFAFVFTCLFSILNYSAIAQSPRTGEELYKQCSSCHYAERRSLAGKDVSYLLQKMYDLENGDFNSGPKKRMKDLFLQMNENEKHSLAEFLNKL